MDGELTEATTGMVDAVGGGNFSWPNRTKALAACEAAIEEMKNLPIMPFQARGAFRPKVGSKYKSPELDQRCVRPT